jgi:SulP family sulfate permease
MAPKCLLQRLAADPHSRHVALYSNKHKYATDSSKELLSLGLANMVGACFLSFSVGGAFSRSAVNDHVGARTQMSLLISGLVVIILTMLICPALYDH